MNLFSLLIFFSFLDALKERNINHDIDFKTVEIDGMTWTAEDINIKLSEKNFLPNSNCTNLYYSWEDAKKIDDQLKEWRLPTREDWRKLERHFGSNQIDEYAAFIYLGDKVKTALLINRFPGIIDNNKIRAQNKEVCYWTCSSTRTVDDPNENIIFVRFFYSTQSEDKNKIYQCIVSESADYRCSMRLIKEKQ